MVLERAWNYIWDRFFCRSTSLFYDYLVGDRPDAVTWHLPSPELIRIDAPNPCGHGTGMEDSMLTAGTVMDTLCAMAAANGVNDDLRARAADVYRGMELCMDVCARPGFVARSVSPADGVSHYTNSSRDQFTHWVYGAWVLYHSPLADELQRASIRRHLALIAARCEADVTEENEWNLLRDDGGIGIVSQMWGELGPHEYLRLPMFYAAAWKTTGDTHWRDLYLKYRAEAYEKTLPFDPDSGRTYIGLQLQYSLRMLWEAEDDPEWKGKYHGLLRRFAEEYAARVVPCAERILTPEGRKGRNWQYQAWNKIRARYVGFYSGKVYYNPGQSEFRENTAFYPLRAVGECAAVAGLCPGFTVTDEITGALAASADAVDYDRHRTYAPLAIVNAYWRIRASAAR